MTHPSDDSIKADQAVGRQATPAEVVVDPEVMGGRPCFAGTRVPAEIVMASVDKGIEWSRLVASYPFLTEAHIAAAQAYLAAPGGQRRGVSRLAGTVVESKVVRSAARDTTTPD